MFRPILSIKLKIILTFAAAFVVFVGILATMGYIMLLLEERVVILEEVSRLEEKVQDLRRCEKNLFLYDAEDCRNRVFTLIEKVERILKSNKDDFERAFSPADLRTFSKNLDGYRLAMSQYPATPPEVAEASEARLKAAQDTIRSIGAQLLKYAESIADQKRNSIQSSIDVVNKLQLAEALLVGVGLFAFGGLVLGKVVNPLRSLQDHAYRIGNGDFREMESPSQEVEIGEVYKAFKRMTRDLRKRQEDLLRSRHLASLGTLLAGVAHELNNPLSNIRSTCQILVEDDAVDENLRRESLLAVIEEVDKAGIIVKDLLELSRAKESRKEIYNLKNLVNRALSLLHGRISAEIEIAVDIPEDLSVFVDSQGVLQALLNVISNAVDAIDGDGTVTIKAGNAVNGKVRVTVTDTGSGMGQEEIDRAFDPFFTTKDVGEGTGLGLFITHGIMERNGGRIGLRSTPGVGTTCVLTLPVKEEIV